MVRSLMLILAFISAGAMADSVREIKPMPIGCVGKNKTSTISLSVVNTEKNGTRLIILSNDGGRINRLIENDRQLTVGSEGNVYIQQVDNKLGYNLYLAGKGLEELLEKDFPGREFKLRGTLSLFGKTEDEFELECLAVFDK